MVHSTDLDLAGLHHPPGVRRQPACLQPDDVGDIDLRQRLPAAGEVAGAEDLEVVRRRVAGEAEVLLPLADDLVADGGGDAVGAEPADGEVVAVVDEAPHGVGDGHDLVDQPARLGARTRHRASSDGIGEERRGHAMKW